MQSRLDDFEDRDATLLAVAADPPERCREVAESYDLGYSLLCDPDLDAIDAFGVRHPLGNPAERVDIARPATFILDREGRVAWYTLPENWRIRVDPDRLLRELDALP